MQKNTLSLKIFLPLVFVIILLSGSMGFLCIEITDRILKTHPLIDAAAAENARKNIAAAATLASFAAAGICFILLRKYLRPLEELVNAAERAAADPARHISIKTGDEIEELTRLFNRVTEDLTQTLVLKDYGDNIIKSMIDTLIVVNLDSTIKSVNQATLDLLGYRESEIIGKSVRLLFADVGTIYIETWLEYLNREEVISNIEETYLARNGRKIPVLLSGSAMRDKDGRIQSIVYVAQDITQRKIAEELIHQSEERYRNLVVTVPDIIYSISITDGTILSLNPAFEKTTGWSCKEWIGRKFVDLVHPDDTFVVKEIYRRISMGSMSRNRELRLKTRTGEYLSCELTSAPQVENGKVVAELGIVRNISERKKAEKEREALTRKLLQSDKMAAVGQLAGGVAHEINNPLGVILGFAQSLLKRTTAQDAVYMPLQSIEREAKRCKNLVHDLLTFSRAGRMEKEKCDLNEVINSALTLIEAQTKFKSVELVKDFSGRLPEVSISRNQIQQVIVNLCNNAIDAMPQNGRLTIRTLAAGPERVEIHVQDNGAGIPKDIQSKVFEPFFTTKEVGKGTGLGLSLVYEIIQRHQGVIEFETEAGKGTVFKISLPLS